MKKRGGKEKSTKIARQTGLTAQASSPTPPTLWVRLLAADLKMNSTMKTGSIVQSVVL